MTKRHRPCSERSCRKCDPGLVSGPGWVAEPGRREPESQKALFSALNQVHDGPRPSTSELLVEAKPAVGVLHSGVEGPAVGAEALAEQVAAVGALPQQEVAIRHIDQLALRLPACDGPPVPALPGQLFELLRQAGHHPGATALHRVIYPGPHWGPSWGRNSSGSTCSQPHGRLGRQPREVPSAQIRMQGR